MMEPIVQIHEVTKRFNGVTALDSATLTVCEGEMVAVVGPDGAGKTTLLRAVSGLLKPDEGSIRLFGEDLSRNRRAIRRRLGYLSQGFSLYRDLTVDENIAFFAQIYGIRHFRERRDELLSFTRLTPFRTRLAGRLSGGMKKKLALACSLIHRPKLLLLDEPTTGVDPVSRRDFWLILGRLLSEGITILTATPYLDEAERCSRVGLLNDGAFLVTGTPDEIRGRSRGSLFEAICEQPRAAQQRLASFSGGNALDEKPEIQTYGDRIHVRFDSGADETVLRTLLDAAEVSVSSVRAIEPSLEDVYITLVEKTI